MSTETNDDKIKLMDEMTEMDKKIEKKDKEIMNGIFQAIQMKKKKKYNNNKNKQKHKYS